jgi:hypothetical protein
MDRNGTVDDGDLPGRAEGHAAMADSHRRAAAERNQKPFSRPVKLAIWIALPAVLWTGIYLALRALF